MHSPSVEKPTFGNNFLFLLFSTGLVKPHTLIIFLSQTSLLGFHTLVVPTPLVAPPPPLILLTFRCLLSADASPPVCHLFASCLLHCPCCCATAASCALGALPPPCNRPHLPRPLVHQLVAALPPLLCCRRLHLITSPRPTVHQLVVAMPLLLCCCRLSSSLLVFYALQRAASTLQHATSASGHSTASSPMAPLLPIASHLPAGCHVTSCCAAASRVHP